MKTENTNALHFILQDDIFLLNQDREIYSQTASTVKSTDVLEEPFEANPLVETNPITFNYLGGNKKNFLITVHYPGIGFMADAHLTALQNTLKRLGFELDDVAILNMANHIEPSQDILVDYFQPKKMLLMGKNALPQGMATINLNEQILGETNILYTFSFDEMMDSNENKKAFWEQIKQL